MKRRASGTAEGVAYMRYYESQRPENKRICNDYMAYSLSAWWVKLAAIICKSIPNKIMDKAFEKKGKGISGYLAVRTRLFDDYVLDSIKNDVEQYVILGAGLDSRAYRFVECLKNVRVFEIDHPSSQAIKKQSVEKLLGKMPVHVKYIPVDFTRDDLLTSLLDAGYNQSLKTVFTFEGVTMYLDEKSVRETFAFILANSGQGSSVMFDYVYAETLDGRKNSRIVSHMNSLKHIFNEPILFGIETGKVEDFIKSIGFEKAKDYPPHVLYDMYIKSCDPNRPISDVYAIAVAYK